METPCSSTSLPLIAAFLLRLQTPAMAMIAALQSTDTKQKQSTENRKKCIHKNVSRSSPLQLRREVEGGGRDGEEEGGGL